MENETWISHETLCTPTYLSLIMRYLTIPEICKSLLRIDPEINKTIQSYQCLPCIRKCAAYHFGENFLILEKDNSKEIIYALFQNIAEHLTRNKKICGEPDIEKCGCTYICTCGPPLALPLSHAS